MTTHAPNYGDTLILNTAYNNGREDFYAGKPEPPKGSPFQNEYRRGYIMTRKHARFRETIAKLALAKATNP